MGKLGGALLILGFLLSLSFFFGMSFLLTSPTDVTADELRAEVERDAQIGALTLALSAGGLVLMVAGGALMALHARRRLQPR